MSNLVKRFKAARRAATPLVSIETPDPASTIKSVMQALNGDDVPLIQWDFAEGFSGFAANPPGEQVVQDLVSGGQFKKDPSKAQPLNAATMAQDAPDGTIVFYHQANKWFKVPGFTQGLWNLRDPFKETSRMAVLLDTVIAPPPEIAGDIIAFDEPYPTTEELTEIINEQLESYNAALSHKGKPALEVDDDLRSRCIQALRGLSAFQAEQIFAMSLSPDGIDVPSLWERKAKQVEQTLGLTFYYGGDGFDQIAGVDPLQTYLRRIMHGNNAPDCVVWLDEIEKSGLAHTGDTSGVNADQLGQLLKYLEDHKVYGVILVGVPGCGKSQTCKNMAGEFGKPVLGFDCGEMKGSHVSESEAYFRAGLKTVTSVGNDNALWIVTSNSIEMLDDALKSRFTDVFFFDLPTKEQRWPIWKIWTEHYKTLGWHQNDNVPKDEGWVGRNIQKCCEKAYRMDISLTEAAEYIIPVARSSAEQIRTLQQQAHGRYLSASESGAYSKPEASRGGRRKMAV